MAGKFFNTTTAYTQMVNQVAETMKGLLDNPYYLFTDKKASECTYYNINTTMTTLDEATRGNYSEIANNSPMRFNKIKNFLIYGATKIDINLDISDFGLETSEITGEAIILPKTIIPYPGDYFYLTQIKEPLLFRVTAVNPNTLDTGATMYRINYMLDSADGIKKIDPQVVKIFQFVLDNTGNGSNVSASIIEEDAFNNASALQNAAGELKDYYISMFYDAKVQSFTYNFNPLTKEWVDINGGNHHLHIANMHQVDCQQPFGLKVYDPYLIEFLIRNKILSGGSNYIFVTQQMFLPSTFAMDYNKTIFGSLEDNKIDKHYGRSVGNLLYCDQTLSLLYAYPIDYYYMTYHNLDARFFYISIFDDPDFKNRIINEQYTEDNPLKDIIIKYFNNKKINADDLDKIAHIDYKDNKTFYYQIPMVIFCIEQQLKTALNGAVANIS